MKKIFYILSTLFIGAALAMEQPNPSQAYTAYILKNKDNARINPAFINFEKAKIRANTAQLLREIPKLVHAQDDIYTPNQAVNIILEAQKLFGGDNQKAPVPGFLTCLEALEKNLCANHHLHGLVNIIYILEHATALTRSNHTILEFQCRVKLPQSQGSNVKEAQPGKTLEIDCDICAQGEDDTLILEKLKHFQFCSPNQLKGVERTLDGLNKIQEKTGIKCRLHSKFAMPEKIQIYAREKNIELKNDSSENITIPQGKPVYQRTFADDSLNSKIRINIPKKCVVCFEQVAPEHTEFTSDLETAHLDYLTAGLSEKVEHYNLPAWGEIFVKAKNKFRLIPGFFKKIIMPCVTDMEGEKWCTLRTTLFELIAAFDAPADKEVVAFGGQLFYDIESPTRFINGPAFKVENGKYKIENGANIGYDLDVVLQDKDVPGKYSFIEATTGGLSVKELEKFQNMGRELNAEVYMLHDFDHNNLTFKRSVYWKNPVIISLPNNQTHHLEWPLASRIERCLHVISDSPAIYNQINLDTSNMDLAEYPEHAFNEVVSNIRAIFKLIDATAHQADEQVFKLKIRDGLLDLLKHEKENDRLGGVALAIQLLTYLKCTIQDTKLRERYLNKTHQYSFDVDAFLLDALGHALKTLNPHNPVKQLTALV